ncbi:MAG: carboxylating nicotinate-nucleotide diphosphorylase [Balneolaceae bacterium]|nr:carboxylating nicotinate-nucleotide diphosphorylase [Balneolaceae bacterium]
MKRTAQPKIITPINIEIEPLVRRALAEDVQSGDLTTERIVPADMQSRAQWVAKEEGIVAGLFVGEAVFRSLDVDIEWSPKVEDGQTVHPGDVLVEMQGQSRALLIGERTALNFVQRMSGIATATSRYVNVLKGTGTTILDTRKTVPGLRALDKYAVKAGGGTNHRTGLYDMVLIKENHIRIAGGIGEAVAKAKTGTPEVKIEVETTSLNEVKQALEAGVDIIMLDNMSLSDMKKAVELIDGRAQTEASGNVTIDRLREIANCGVDFISAGALTHSVSAFDISQLIKN